MAFLVGQPVAIELWSGYDKSHLLHELNKDGLTVSRVVVPRSQRYRDGSLKLMQSARDLAIPTVEVGLGDSYASLGEVTDDALLVSGRFPLRIPPHVVERYRYAINVHPTLLPKYRGRYLEPILINGDRVSGVTVHLLSAEYDAGPIVAQVEYEVGTFDTVQALLRKAEQNEAEAIRSAIANLLTPGYAPRMQSEEQASNYFSQRTPEDSFIPCSASLQEALNVVRACNAVTHPAFTIIEGEMVCIQMYRPNKPSDEVDCI